MPRPEVIHLSNGLLSACSCVVERKTTTKSEVTCKRCLAIIAKRAPQQREGARRVG